MSARLAAVFRGHDETPLRQRVRVVAGRVTRAPDEPLPIIAVANRELSRSAFLAAADEILDTDGGAIGCDAVGRGPAAIRVLDHRRAALRAVLFRSLDDSHLRQGVRVPAGGVAVASEETGTPSRPDHGEVPFLAHVAFADVVLLPERRFDLLADRLAVRLQRLEDLAQHLLGFPDDILSGAGTGRNRLHIRLEVGGHLRFRDSLCVILKGLDHRAPTRRRLRVLPFDELPVVELLDDLVPRGLRPEADSFHLLDQGTLAVPRWGFRAVLAECHRPDTVQRFASRESRQDRLSDRPIWVIFPPSRILDPVSFCEENLAAEVDLRFRGLGDRVRCHRGEDAPHDELVNRPVIVPFHLFSRDTLDRVDRRGGPWPGTTPTRDDPLFRGEYSCLPRKTGNLEVVEDRSEVYGGGI